MTFARDIKQFVLQVRRDARDIYVGTATEVHRSVQTGSEITGAPGQPVDTANLRNSWQLAIGPEEAEITTNVEYAPHVEDNVRGVTFKNHGPHSVKLTVAGFPRIVEHVTREVTGQ